MEQERACRVCGKKFRTNVWNKICCSADCAEINSKRQKKAWINAKKQSRTCVVCGATFQAGYRTLTKTCSEECLSKLRSELKSKQKKKEKKVVATDNLSKNAKEAGARGMTYGKLKALETLEQIRKVDVNI